MAANMTGIVRPPNAPRTMRLNQSLSLGHSLTPPTIDATAVFGPPRFTPEEQAANPTKPMTRVVKDVLRIGKWNVGGPTDPVIWDVTPETLAALANSTATQQATGHAINVGMSHGGEGLIVPTADLVAPIDAVAVSGNALWMACYVTPEQARALENPACKVSPGLMWDYADGSGRKHPIALVHVAVTDRPVVAGQGKFLALANDAAPSNVTTSKGRSMNFAAILALFNSLLTMLGAPALPDDTTEANLEERGNFVLKMLGGGADAPADPATEPATDGTLPPLEGGAGMNNARGLVGVLRARKEPDIAAIVNKAIAPLTARVAQLSNAIQGGAATHAQSAFEARCTELGKSGVSAAVLEEKRELGASFGWDIRLLTGLQPAVAMSNASRKGATNGPPPNGATDGNEVSDDVIRGNLKAKGLTDDEIAKFMPK
jgi:hypothetical protein